MPLTLSQEDRHKLEGEFGPATKMAMSILVRMARVFQAEHLIDISAAHIDSTLYMGDATLEYAERLADLGAEVAVPTTLNVTGVDEHGWQEWPVPPQWAQKAKRQMDAYRSMGTIPTWTCAPYQTTHAPEFGQQIAWGESNAVVFANSVLGARTNRYPDLLDICAAITGRVPATGLHLTENRGGQLLFEVNDIPVDIQNHDTFYPALGHLVGREAGDSIPVIQGLATQPTEDQFKALGAAAASSGAVALFHIVGITPEAPTLQAAFQGKDPHRTHSLTMDALQASWQDLTAASGTQLDMVAVGCPHFSIDEFRTLHGLTEGKRCHPDVTFVATTNRAVLAQSEEENLLDPLRAFGATFTLDTCLLTTPMLPATAQRMMTNSAKYAYYAPGMLNTETVFGALSDCVASAIRGEVTRTFSPWEGPDR